MTIGMLLRGLRLAHGRTLREVGERSGFSATYLSQLERSKRSTFDAALASLNRILACYHLEAVLVIQDRTDDSAAEQGLTIPAGADR